jgi:dTDP-glucose pyrophosphorylase
LENKLRINLIPMAGLGQRYVDAGYSTPKPLLDVHGLPMIIRAAKALPIADRYIFVCRKAHVQAFDLQNLFAQHFADCTIIELDALTEGQAATCMQAKDAIPENALLTVGASDNDMIYNHSSVENLQNDENVDAWVWTFRHHACTLQKPNDYGWVQLRPNSIAIEQVSCKKTISDHPQNDHAIIGAFTFKKAKDFFDAIAKMMAANDRINNEFYLDVAINHAIDNGLKIHVLEVEKYISWGTPKDYEAFLGPSD